MECFNCGEPLNPTLVYCSGCGAPVDADIEDIARDEEERAEFARRVEGERQAKELLVTAVFLFACIVALRMLLLKEKRYDHFSSFRAPYALVDEAKLDPPVSLDVEELKLPFPKLPGEDDEPQKDGK